MVDIQVCNISERDAQRFEEIHQDAILEENYLLDYPDEYGSNIERRKDWIRKFNENPNHRLYGAFVDGRLEGYLTSYSQNFKRIQHTTALSMVVSQEKRGQGLGSRLLFHFFESIEHDSSIQRVQLSVISSNVRAQSLYQKFGFVVEGRRTKAYLMPDGRYEDEVLMGWCK